MLAFTGEARLANGRENLFSLGQLLLDPAVQPFVLEVEHRILIANRRLDEPFRVARGRRIHDLEAGRMQEGRLGILRMERTAAHIPAAGPAHHQRGRKASAVARGRDIIREHVVGAGDEVDELHLRHGAQSHMRGARSRSDDRRLGDWRVDDARRAEPLAEPVRDLEGAAVQADIFAEDEHAVVALHLLP